MANLGHENHEPDVAVIIPTFNRADMMREAIESILAQTYRGRIEIVVVDDDSTDHTPKLLAEYAARYGNPDAKRFVRHLHQPNQGQAIARSVAIAASGAPLIAFLDDDDLSAPERIQRQVDALEHDPQVGLVHSSFRYIDGAGAFIDEGPQRLSNPCMGWCVKTLLAEFVIIFSTVMVRRDVLDQAARAEPHGLPFDPTLTRAQDYDLCLRVARMAPVAYVPEVLVHYRLHGGNHAMAAANLKRSFRYHCQVQLDFVRRWGSVIGLCEDDARDAVRSFLYSRAESLYWQRKLQLCCDLCDLAEELSVADPRFAVLKNRAGRPAWVLKVKDWVDQLADRWVRR